MFDSLTLAFVALGTVIALPFLGAGLAKVVHSPIKALYAAIFASGILITPSLPIVREKLAATELCFLVLWFSLLLPGRREPYALGFRQTRGQRVVVFAGWLFIGWILLSFFVNNLDSAHLLTGSAVETANFLYGYLIFLTTLSLVSDWRKFEQCLMAWSMGAAVVAVFGVWALIGGAPAWTYDDFTGRVSSTLKFENQIPAFLMPILPYLMYRATSSENRGNSGLVYLAILGGSVVTLVGTGSRTAVILLGLFIVGALFTMFRNWNSPSQNRVVVVGMVGAAVLTVPVYFMVSLALYDGDYRLGKTPAWQRPAVMLVEWWEGKRIIDTTRTEQFNVVWERFADAPVLGTGPKLSGGRFGISEIHNTYASVLIEMGIVGLALFLVWLGLILVKLGRAGLRYWRPEMRIMLTGLLIGALLLLAYGMTMYGLRQRSIWLVAGLLAAGIGIIERERAAARSAPMSGVFARPMT